MHFSVAIVLFDMIVHSNTTPEKFKRSLAIGHM